MRVLLISANTERISMVTLPLGLGLVAAAARRAGHEAVFLDLLTAEDPRRAIREAVAALRPQVIGISVRNIDDQNRQEPHFLLEKTRELVAECRASSAAAIVLGGAGYSIFPRDVQLVSDRLAARGIRRTGFLLLGGPGETPESVEESLAFARSLRLDDLRITVGIRIYPGTPLAARAVAEGLLAPGEDLLPPHFYLAEGLEPWIHERVESFSQAAP